MKNVSSFVLLCILQAVSSSVLFNGNLNNLNDFDTWSWQNPVGEWQTYIYGTVTQPAKASNYLRMSPSFKNPADTISTKGVEVKIDSNSYWNGPPMLRTEMIPNIPNSNYQSGKIYYKWSMKQTTDSPLRTANEHQLVFFESHFCEIKYGGASGDNLAFFVAGNSAWTTPFTKGTWFNFAFEIDYGTKSVALYQSTANSNLVKVYGPTTVNAVGISDFHVGNLRLPVNGAQDPATELLYYSGIQVVTTLAEANPGNGVAPTGATSAATSASTSASASASISTSNRNPTTAATSASTSNRNPTTAQSTSNNVIATSQSRAQSSQTNPQTSTSPVNNCADTNYCINTCGKGNVLTCTCVRGSLFATCADKSSRITMAPFAFLLFVILLSI